jgi:hypothetical protein
MSAAQFPRVFVRYPEAQVALKEVCLFQIRGLKLKLYVDQSEILKYNTSILLAVDCIMKITSIIIIIIIIIKFFAAVS